MIVYPNFISIHSTVESHVSSKSFIEFLILWKVSNKKGAWYFIFVFPWKCFSWYIFAVYFFRFSCTAFAFGQTGSGKTYTITGPFNPVCLLFSLKVNMTRKSLFCPPKHFTSQIKTRPRSPRHFFEQKGDFQTAVSKNCLVLERLMLMF